MDDQVGFDLAVHCLGDYNIVSPIREIQKLGGNVREYEKQYLLNKGFSVNDKVSRIRSMKTCSVPRFQAQK